MTLQPAAVPPKPLIVTEMPQDEKEKFERAEFLRKKKELNDAIMKDAQDPNTTTIVFMKRRVSDILFHFKDRDDISLTINQEDLQEFRLIEIKIMMPYLKILFIPKNETKPETSHNYYLEGDSMPAFEMTYIDHCTDCLNPRNPIDRTVAI